MKVDSHNTEFGYELIAALPYAYHLHVNGLLEGTRSGIGSEAFYWFSQHHEINPEPRDFAHTAAAAQVIPNMWIHKARLDKRQWTPPPLKEHFAPRAITFEKPTVVLCNRYNREWEREPINFFDLPTLRTLFTQLCPNYTVVYVNVRGREELEDNAHSMDLGDYEMIAAEFPDVRIIHDLIDQYGGDFNDVQCRVFAGCSKFITMNGGHAILCSYFGGENIIYTKECRELRVTVNSFYNWYHDFGGAHIRVVNSYEDLLATVDSAWVRKDPLLNILVRCHDRPKGLQRLWDSIQAQGYRNVRVIASYDNESTWKYVSRMPFEKVAVSPATRPQHPGGDDYKGFLPANLYLNEMAERVQHGIVMYMDDDDLYAPGTLQHVAAASGPTHVTLWTAMDRSGCAIPSDANRGKVVAGDISGIAFAFDSVHLNIAQWEPWRRGDFRVIRKLINHLKQSVFLEEATSIMGERIDGKKPRPSLEESRKRMAEKAEEINAKVRLQQGRGETSLPRPGSRNPLSLCDGVTIRAYRPT